MKKVMVFGTFDALHKGHSDFFRQARKLGDKLIIIVAKDRNVKKIKGKMPNFSERERLIKVNQEIKRSTDVALLGGLKDPYTVIRKFKPDIIALGYDQNSFNKGLKNKFPNLKIVRLKPYKKDIYKSSKIKQKLRIKN